MEQMARGVAGDVRVVEFTRAHGEAFRSLNLDWITRYFTVEDADRRALDDPEGHILAHGGFIFVAEERGAAVGACAMLRNDDGSFELAKMAVAESARGKGIGLLLGTAVIAKARALGAPRVELLSNTLLRPAIHLYEKLGFVEIPLPPNDYRRANIKMVLELSARESG